MFLIPHLLLMTYQPLDLNVLCCTLQKNFPHHTFGINIFDTIDSTNRFLLEKDIKNLDNSKKQIHICLAEQQSAGRGRQGKTWFSPFGTNLYCSILWPFTCNQLNLEGLSLAVGITVAKTLKEYGVEQISLKWPNDVLCQDKKIAGILLEITNSKNQHTTARNEDYKVVIGVGINIFLSSVIQPNDANIDQPWIDIASVVNFQPNRNQVVINFLTHLFNALSLFEIKGFAPFQPEWLHQDALVNQSVTLQTGQGTVTGISRGVDHRGRLLLEISGKIEPFISGQILKTRVMD